MRMRTDDILKYLLARAQQFNEPFKNIRCNYHYKLLISLRCNKLLSIWNTCYSSKEELNDEDEGIPYNLNIPLENSEDEDFFLMVVNFS